MCLVSAIHPGWEWPPGCASHSLYLFSTHQVPNVWVQRSYKKMTMVSAALALEEYLSVVEEEQGSESPTSETIL